MSESESKALVSAIVDDEHAVPTTTGCACKKSFQKAYFEVWRSTKDCFDKLLVKLARGRLRKLTRSGDGASWSRHGISCSSSSSSS